MTYSQPTSFEQRHTERLERYRRRLRASVWIGARAFVVALAVAVLTPFAYDRSATLGKSCLVAALFVSAATVVAGVYAAWFFYQLNDEEDRY